MNLLAAVLSTFVYFAPSVVRAEAAGVVAPSAPFKLELERAYRLKESGQGAESAAVFAGVLRKDPRNHAAAMELGYLYVGLKRYDVAAKYLALASAQTPDDMRLRMDLAYAWQELKRPVAAAKEFEVVAAAPGEFQMQARRQLGYAHLAAGRLPEAAAQFEAVRAAQPLDGVVALQLGYAYSRMKNFEKAREAFGAAAVSGDLTVSQAAQAALKTIAEPLPAIAL